MSSLPLVDNGPEQGSYLKQILDNLPDGIFTISNELQINYVNPAFCKLLGFDEQEILGTSITDYLGDLNILDACMAEVARTGKCNDQETIFKRKDGSHVHIAKSVQAVCDEAGNFKEILVSIRDMTDLHRLNHDLATSKQQLEEHTRDLETTLSDLQAAQKQLVESEKLASLGSLVAGIAHEINTPLGISVTSASSMHDELVVLREKFLSGSLKRTEFEQFMEQTDEIFNILNGNLQRASDLVNSFKRVAVDQTVQEMQRINLNEYCTEVLTSLIPRYKNRPVKVINECHPDIELCTNAGAIYQILGNLVVNSLVHAYEKNDPGVIRISAEQDGDRVELSYQDDGKGIAAEDLSRIFEPFFTTRRGKGGSGLGLSIVYNLVTGSLKGNILAESRPGEGARFLISLPTKLNPEEPACSG